MPVAIPLALVQMARGGWSGVWWLWCVVRRRPRPAGDAGWTALVTAWLATTLVSFLTVQTELRFRILVITPVALLAGVLVPDAARSVARLPARRHRRLGVVLGAAVVACALGWMLRANLARAPAEPSRLLGPRVAARVSPARREARARHLGPPSKPDDHAPAGEGFPLR